LSAIGCKTRASIPLDAWCRHPRDTLIWKLEGIADVSIMQEGPLRAARAHDQADRDARDITPYLWVYPDE
jgi:hypothetical protein